MDSAKKKSPKTIDEYFHNYPRDVQDRLKQIRAAVKEIIPEGEEAIKYGMPTFRYAGYNLISFGAYKKHIGFYPAMQEAATSQADLAFLAEKATAQFPYDQPLPIPFIKSIVKFRVAEASRKK
jgi:uncharacterized protein YdhG (YjbR/CyaY superfamily)